MLGSSGDLRVVCCAVGCGGRRQACCQTAQPCQPGLACKIMGERSWFSATGK